MQSLYFAYGSNLSSERLRARVVSAVAVGPALLPGRRLCLDKRGRDGSGKANLRVDARASAWGVVYAIAPDGWPALDAVEAGYQRVRVEVARGGQQLGAWTYVSERLTDDPVAFFWYKRLIVEGAREHGLPAEWVALLEALPERPDPDLT